VMAIPMTDTLTALADAVVKGELRVPITKTYSLDEVPQALKHFTSGKLGKIAVAIS
jgi:NADPH:quinone reductase-like Zn-dependent oxidoreductase